MTTKDSMELWVKEIYQETFNLGFKIDRTLFSGKSRFQQIDVVKTKSHGVMLLNDGSIMLSERDEFIYHEMIAHVPLFVHPSPERVLVIGGGDGGTVREVLKHPKVKRVVMVEIDDMVIQACRIHLPAVSCALDDERLEIRIQDGIKYITEAGEKFDLVIVDSTDPIGPAVPLFDKPFYKGISAALDSDGILITQAGSTFYDGETQHAMLMNQRPFFKNLHLYLYSNLTYPGGLWSFGFASKGLCPIQDFDGRRVESSGIVTSYYNPGVHRSAFSLPNFVAENLASVIDPILV
jgi:spermidine synthase